MIWFDVQFKTITQDALWGEDFKGTELEQKKLCNCKDIVVTWIWVAERSWYLCDPSKGTCAWMGDGE